MSERPPRVDDVTVASAVRRRTTRTRAVHLRVSASVGSVWILALSCMVGVLIALVPSGHGSSSASTTAWTGTVVLWLVVLYQIYGGVWLWRCDSD